MQDQEAGCPVIEAEDLTRRFGAFVAVESVALHVPDGTILALLGPNGAGKTTTVRMLAGLLGPTAGTARVAGADVRADPAAVRARVGLVTDAPGLYEQMTAAAYLDFFASLYGMPRTERRRRIDGLVGFFDLDGHRSERMLTFSKGMKQKVALARALLHEPAALFLDEPTSGLDPLASRAVRDLVVGLKHASRSIILCTHDLDEAERLADQVAIMRRGRIVACDTPAALRAQSSPLTTVRITLAADSSDAHAVLAATDGVLAPAPAPDGIAQGAALEYQTPDPAAINPRVIARLVAAGVQIISVTCVARSLEDVYAEVMGDGRTSEAEAAPSPLVSAGQRWAP